MPQPILLRWYAKPLALPFHIVIPKRFSFFILMCNTSSLPSQYVDGCNKALWLRHCGSNTAEKYHIDFHPRLPFHSVLLLMFSLRRHTHKYYSITPDIFKVLNVHLFMQISLIDLLNGYAIFGSIWMH